MPGRLNPPRLSTWSPPGGGEELCLAFDNGEEARLIVLPAWFDEANKTRHFTVETMRRIHARGWAVFLPDLPGCNESSAALASQDLESWRGAASEAARQCGATHCLTIRAGASLAPEGLAGWRYAPIAATAALKALLRARILASKEAGVVETSNELIGTGCAEGLELAGYALGPAMIGQMAGGALPEGGGLTDIAQREVGGGGLWLRAEPGFDADQADRLADIIGSPTRPSTGSGRTEEGAAPARPSTGSGRTGEFGTAPQTARGEPVEPRAPRRHISFPCEGEVLAGTLDEGGGDEGALAVGLLVVTGGNETRAGAFSGMAELAARVAAAGHPVLRFDRRGTGDSTGTNGGFRGSGPDIAAACAAFRAEAAGLRKVVGFGNCDAASALMLAGGAGCDALVLANPWTFDEEDAGRHSGAELRGRYAEKLRDPRELVRLLTGEVSLRKLVGGLRQALAAGGAGGSVLAREMAEALAGYGGAVHVLLAERDRTAQAFRENWPGGAWPVEICAGASHAFAEADAREWLLRRVMGALGKA